MGASDVGMAQKDGTDMVLFANTDGEVLFARGGRTGYVKMAVDMDAGGVSIGHNVHSNTPPTSGLYVEGQVGIGTTNPSHMLQVDSIADVEGLQVNGAENQYTASFRANTTTGKAYGPYIRGGTNTSDSALVVDSADGTSNYFKIRGDGNVGIGTTNPATKLHVDGEVTAEGALNLPIRTVTDANTNLDESDYTVLGVNATGGDITFTLPDAALCEGRLYNIKKIAGANDIIVASAAGNIDGVATKTISSLWVAVTVQSNGTNWYII